MSLKQSLIAGYSSQIDPGEQKKLQVLLLSMTGVNKSGFRPMVLLGPD